jgi:hypothetical protein
MTTRTITSLYDTYDDAVQTVRDLEAANLPHDKISMVASNADNRYVPTHSANTEVARGAGTGASVGTVVGGGVGLLAGLGVLAIPGVGPVVAAGWLLSTLLGAAAGAGVAAASCGIIGAMIDEGVTADHAHVYAEGVRRGGTLVTARVDASRAAVVDGIMRQHHPVDLNARGMAYRGGGWTEFDEKAPALAVAELERERALYRRDRAI